MKKAIPKKAWLVAADVLVIPGMILCEKLSDLMLSQYSECFMLRLGGKCITCGGTHFVNTLLNFKILEAFRHNEFLFLLSAFLGVCFILWNLDWFFGVGWAKKLLKKFISIPSLIVWCAGMLSFFFLRNIPVFIRVGQIISQWISTKL